MCANLSLDEELHRIFYGATDEELDRARPGTNAVRLPTSEGATHAMLVVVKGDDREMQAGRSSCQEFMPIPTLALVGLRMSL